MPAKKRRKLMRKGANIPYIEMIEFDNRMEELIAGAKAVVAMGGYNTYCEILSFDKPALIVPRVEPRQEQLIRAQTGRRTRPHRNAAARGGRGRGPLRRGIEGPARPRAALEKQSGPHGSGASSIFPRSSRTGSTGAPSIISR